MKEMTHADKVKMYRNIPIGDLIEMLIEANNQLEILTSIVIQKRIQVNGVINQLCECNIFHDALNDEIIGYKQL